MNCFMWSESRGKAWREFWRNFRENFWTSGAHQALNDFSYVVKKVIIWTKLAILLHNGAQICDILLDTTGKSKSQLVISGRVAVVVTG
jgi:hypothetical protein